MGAGLLAGLLFALPSPVRVLAPVPLILAARRGGPAEGLLAGAIGLAPAWIVGVLGARFEAVEGLVTGLLPATGGFVLGVAAPAALIAWACTRSSKGGEVVALAAAPALALGGLGLLGAAWAAGGLDPLLGPWIDEAVDRVLAVGREQALRTEDAAAAFAELEASRGSLRRWGARLAPSLFGGALVLGLWINLVYSRWFAGPLGPEDDLTRWRLPMGVMYALMGCIAVTVAQVGIGDLRLPRSEWLLAPAANGVVLSAVLYWLQGVAVANYYFVRFPLPPLARLAGVGLQAVLMLHPRTTLAFTALGLADAWFDLRRPRPGEQGAGRAKDR